MAFVDRAVGDVPCWTGTSGSAICLRAFRRFAAPRGVYLFFNPCARQAAPKFKGTCVQVLVRDNNVDQALKALKKKMQREGIFREMKLRGHYEKPSEKRAREKAEALRRARKLARKKLQREGLLPMKPKPIFGAR
jgi:small subunit ribosomal protein S21